MSVGLAVGTCEYVCVCVSVCLWGDSMYECQCVFVYMNVCVYGVTVCMYECMCLWGSSVYV